MRTYYAACQERIRRMDVAVEASREGWTQAELGKMTAAMTAESIEPAKRP